MFGDYRFPKRVAFCRKIYEEIIAAGCFDVRDRNAMKEYMYKTFNERNEFGPIARDDFGRAYDAFLETLDGSNCLGRRGYTKHDCFRTMYLNVISIYNKYSHMYLWNSSRVCDTLEDRIIEEYIANESFPTPMLRHDLEYVVRTVMQFGIIGYSIMEQLDRVYGYDGDLPTNNAMDILTKHIE